MTTPAERYGSLVSARRLLVDILARQVTPAELRIAASSILKHFPAEHDLASAASQAPDIFAIPEPDWSAVQSISSRLGIPAQEAVELLGNEFRATQALELIMRIASALDSMDLDRNQKTLWLHSANKNECFDGETPFRYMCRGLYEIEVTLTYVLAHLESGGS